MKRCAVLLIVSLIAVLTPIGDADGQYETGPVSSLAGPVQPSYVLLEESALPSPDGEYPVFRPADVNSKPAQEAARLLEQSYARQALMLHQYVKNYLAYQPGVDPAVAAEPTYLVLGGSGGYADLGFWLEDAQGQLIDKRTTSYVWGLSIDEGSWGDFEQVFPHELGHAILQELAGWQQETLAAQVHQVTLVTDYFYGFNEGWGEHFQTVAVDHTTNIEVQALRETPLLVDEQGPYARLAHELKRNCLLCPAQTSLPLWHNQREGHLRYAGVKANLFAYQPTVPEVLICRDDPYAALLYQSIVPPDGSHTFKNGPQMLASEGLIATLFYRLVNDPRLQQTYREPTFYELFLPPGHEVDWSQTSPEELFSPMENVYLKLFQVFARHVRLDGDLLGESPTILMVKGYAMDYLDEAEPLYDVFLEVTQGVTAEPRALQMAQDWTEGKLTTAEHQAYLEGLRQRLLTGQVRVDSALGPQLWLRNTDVQVSVWLLDAHASILSTPYHFNLNAATVVDLRTVPGVSVQLAREIVRVQDERGGFSSLEDLADIPGMTPDILNRFRSMHQAMQVWINQEANVSEDELEIGAVLWSLAKRLLMELTLASAVAGLIFAVGRFLLTVSVKRLGLEAGSTDHGRTVGKIRRIIRLGGWPFVAVLLPVTLFYLGQIVLLNGGQQVPSFAFAIVVWLLTLPGLGWRLARHRLSGRAVLHRAAWTLLTYAAMFGTLGWLMGI